MRCLVHKMVWLGLLLGLCVAQNAMAATTAYVVWVTDGDTLKVLTTERRLLTVRLAHIDAPESVQAYGWQARLELHSLVIGRQLRLEERGKDEKGRMLAVIYAGRENVNLALVQRGAAWAYLAYAPPSNIILAERSARDRRAGLWSLPNPVPPWIFRRNG